MSIKDTYEKLGVRLFGYSDEKGRELVNTLGIQEYKEKYEGFATCINNHYSQDFTLLHELGHILAGHLVTPYRNESAELEADVFAATILALRWYEKIFKGDKILKEAV